jgi:hypothetical protein
MKLPPNEHQRLVESCRTLAPATGNYLVDDLVGNLLLTVIDFQLRTTVVERAYAHYRENRWDQLRSMDDLLDLLRRFPDDETGNRALARHLWGYELWTRAHILRDLVCFFDANGVRTQADLTAWAQQSEYKQDFEGKVKGLGFAVYNWLVMRQGVETIKPDVHVMRFVQAVVGRPVQPTTAVDALVAVAKELSLKAYELDWRIWEYQRASGRP